MKRIIIALLLLPMVCGQLDADLETVKQDYNAKFEQVPGFIKTLIGTERINCYITLDNGELMTLSAVTNKGMIEELAKGEQEGPTLIVNTTQQTIQSILDSEDPFERLKQALKDDEISYQATSFGKKVKWGINGILVKVSGWFIRIIR